MTRHGIASRFPARALLLTGFLLHHAARALGQTESPSAPTAPGPTALTAPAGGGQDSTSGASGAAGGPSGVGSPVGYIDNAIPVDMLRFRFDSGYNLTRPNRAEYFYARPLPGPGVPKSETGIQDYQDFMFYAEKTFGERLSGFVEVPWRILNPEVNINTSGFSDMYAGLKYAFVSCEDRVASFQFKTYIPTGDARRGLGNHHVTLEPGLLLHEQFTEKLSLDGELRYWIPVGGTSFAGSILRYGVGLSYAVFETCSLRVAPVAEFVGWTVLGGHESFPAGSQLLIEDSAGDTIVNAKLGVRVNFGKTADLYAGYGRALTGDQWYSDIVRIEFRFYY
jgi:hypothetical protein